MKITSKTVTRYQIGGKGRTFGSRMTACRYVAIGMVNRRCVDDQAKALAAAVDDCVGIHSCRRCNNLCVDCECDYSDGPVGCRDSTHSYRYRLIGRLARWLKWRDSRLEKKEHGR